MVPTRRSRRVRRDEGAAIAKGEARRPLDPQEERMLGPDAELPVKLRVTWNVPGAALPEESDAAYCQVRLPAVRSLPGLMRHSVLRFLQDARGGPPIWWRGEELWFANRADLDRAVESETWAFVQDAAFCDLVSGPRTDAFLVDEEFIPPGAGGRGPSDGDPVVTALIGAWQVPAHQTPAEVDPVYLDVHVPNVRNLPRLRSHTVMRAFDWPVGEHARYWRSAEIRFASREDFTAVFAAPEYDAIRHDGFNRSVAGPDVDIFTVEEEWTAQTVAAVDLEDTHRDGVAA
jgi:uncharacterized protein (TIGR02118 family)